MSGLEAMFGDGGYEESTHEEQQEFAIRRVTGTKFKYHQDGTLPSYPCFFVFGSNLSGIHGAGAAKAAMDRFYAERYVGFGFTGHSYAIPTKDYLIETMPLEEIKPFIRQFVHITQNQRYKKFFVTRVGCGLAGFKDSEIAPLFRGCSVDNVSMPDTWKEYLEYDVTKSNQV